MITLQLRVIVRCAECRNELPVMLREARIVPLRAHVDERWQPPYNYVKAKASRRPLLFSRMCSKTLSGVKYKVCECVVTICRVSCLGC